jgi:hypothetical protein
MSGRQIIDAEELARRAQVAHLERQVETMRQAFARLQAQRDVIDAAAAIIDAEYDRLGEVGAL